MQRSTATRRLVKSPPELWAELSSEEALGRHLAQFGEIRITRVSPETTVAWEGDRIRGTVELEATGWGTKVSLTATPTAAQATVPAPPLPAPPAPAEPASQGAQRAQAPARVSNSGRHSVTNRHATPEAAAPGTTPPAEPPATVLGATPLTPAQPAAREQRAEGAEPPPAAATDPAPEQRRGFFARLFRRRRAEQPAAGIPGPPVPTPDPSPPTPGPVPGPPAPGPDPSPPDPGPAPNPPPQIRAPQPGHDPERTVAILTEVLDDLGAAHHRPFSRD